MMATAPIALTGARVICPATGHDGIATIMLKDRKVAGIGHAEPPSDATVIDARGLVVAPGIQINWQAIAGLRREGHTVVCVLPGHEHEVNEFDCDRELVRAADHWVVQALDRAV